MVCKQNGSSHYFCDCPVLGNPPVPPSSISAAVELNSSALPEKAVPVGNEAPQLETSVTLEASIVPKEMASEDVSEASDQVNGAAAVQVAKDQVVESAVEEAPVLQQETPANPSVTAAELAPTKEPVPPVEDPPSASGETLVEEKGATTDELVDSQTAVADKTESRAREFTDEIVAEVKLAADVVPVEPKLMPSKDPVVDREVEKASVAPESTDECVDDDSRKTATQDPGIVSGYKNVDLVTKNENPVEREPAAVDNKGIQSKQSNNAGASHSTRQLSGGLTCITFLPTPHNIVTMQIF